MITRPPYLHPLRRDVPPLEDAFAACTAAFAGRDVPTHLCAQCFPPDWEARVIAAAKLVSAGGAPKPEDYAQIYFEHPGCCGGEETIKLFAPYGIRDLITGRPPAGFAPFSYPEVFETMIHAGYWFWPDAQIAAVRTLAMRLFWDWFGQGRYDWPTPDYRDDHLLGPGDDILHLCALSLIDPYDLVATLTTMHTPWADEALCGPLNFSGYATTYVAADTGRDDKRYREASDTIAQTLRTREATGFVELVTLDWAEHAFFRNTQAAPELAARMSEFANYYDIRMMDTVETAALPVTHIWPDLPQI